MKRFTQTIIAVFFILFSACSVQKVFLPVEVSGFSLNKKLTGSEAEAFVNRLHYGTVAADENEIGFYSSEKGSAIIYISYYYSDDEADQILLQMVEKIENVPSPFEGGDSFELSDHIIYRYSGLGQSHFVFSSGNVLLWISADVMWAELFLNDYIRKIT